MIFFFITCILLTNNINSVPFEKFFINAAKKYNIPFELLIAIASVESNYNPNAINYNSNGTYDIGIMKINSIWFNKLESEYNINQKQVKSPCQNIMIGAWILSQNINKYGFSWTSIQKYNGYDTNLKYSKKIYQTITKLYPQLNTNLSINKTNSKFLYVN
jgi:soluble lytic murein transglycosylase-like protein